MKRFLTNIYWEKVVIVGFFLFVVILAVSVGSCSTYQDKFLRDKESAARMYEVEAAETRGYLNALKDTGNAPRPTGGAK